MRPPAALAAHAATCLVPVVPAILAGAQALACGGQAFVVDPSDSGLTPPDAAPDAGGGFCAAAGKHTFCDGFDGPPLATVWSSIDQNNGTASTDSSIWVSPPHSLASVVEPSALTVTNRGRVIRGFGTQVSRVVLSFQLYIDEVGDRPLSGGDSLVVLALGPGYTIGLDAYSGTPLGIGYFESQIADGGLFPTTLSSRALLATAGLLKTWTPVTIALDLTRATVSITINGTLLVDGASITPPSGQAVVLDLGAQARNVASAVGAHYDNVTVDITP